jgi:hypothetical protein
MIDMIEKDLIADPSARSAGAYDARSGGAEDDTAGAATAVN